MRSICVQRVGWCLLSLLLERVFVGHFGEAAKLEESLGLGARAPGLDHLLFCNPIHPGRASGVVGVAESPESHCLEQLPRRQLLLLACGLQRLQHANVKTAHSQQSYHYLSLLLGCTPFYSKRM